MLIISTGCSKPEHPIQKVELENINYPLTLVKEKEVKIDAPGTPALIYLNNPNHITVSLELKGNLFLTYDRDLNLIEKNSIPYGQGPKECLLPVAMGGDEENVVIFDVQARQYYVYQDHFKSRKRLEGTQRGWIPHGGNYSYSQKTILSCYQGKINLAKEKKCRAQLNIYLRKINDGRLEDKNLFSLPHTVFLENLVAIFATPVHFRLIDDFVYILQKAPYQIAKFDLNGNRVKEIQVTGLPDVRFSKRRRGDWIEALGLNFKRDKFTFPERLWHANFVIGIAGGIAVGRMEDYKPQKKEWIDADFFDKELRFLGKIKLPWFPAWNCPDQTQSDRFFACVGNRLYFIDTRETDTDEEYWLTSWRIKK